MKTPFSFTFVFTLVLTFFIAIVLGLAAPVYTGAPITPMNFVRGFCIGMVVGMAVGLVLPINKIQNAFCAALGANSQLSQSFVGPMAGATIIFTIMNFSFTAINTGFATFMTDAGPLTFMDRFMSCYAILWAFVYVSVVISSPISFAIARKLTGFPPAYDEK